MEKRVGLRSEIGGITWSPWAGVTVKELRVLPIDEGNEGVDLCRIGKVSIDPSWGSLLKGKKRWESLQVSDLEMAVSLEQLNAMISRFQKKPKQVEVTPPLVVKDVDQKTGSKDPQPIRPSSGAGKSPSETVPKVEKKPNRSEQVATEMVPVDDFEGRVVLENCRFRFFSEKEPLMRVDILDVNGEFPVWGKDRSGEIKVGSLGLAESFFENDLTIPVTWRGGELEVEDYEVKLFGLNFVVTAALKPVNGLPGGLQIDLPKQQADLSSMFREKKPPFSIGSVRAQTVIRGYLSNPGSLNGYGIANVKDVVFHDLRDGGDTRFDRGSASVKLNSAGIVVEHIRAIGDDDAVLMNGYVSASGESAAVIRIVSSPERADSHRKRVRNASSMFDLEFRPLVTPDRQFRDLHVETRAGTLAIDLGEESQWVPFFPAVRAVLGSSKNRPPTLP